MKTTTTNNNNGIMKARDLKRARNFLLAIEDIKSSKDAANVLKVAPTYVINAISEVLYNMLMNERMRLTPQQKAILRKHRLLVSRLGSTRNGLTRRRQQIVKYKQRGGFIGAILPLIATVLGQLL